MKKLEKWNVIKKEDVSVSRWLPIEKQTVKLPNGEILDDYFVALYGKVAMVVPFTEDNQIVLVRQYKHAYGDFTIELPAGFQKKGSTIEESALLELEEETGIKTNLGNLISLGHVSNTPTKTTHVTYGFLAKNLKFNSIQNLEISEEIEILKYSPKKTLEMIRDGEIIVGDSISFISKVYLLFPELFLQ